MSNEERDGNLGEVIDRREQVYGNPLESFARIALNWSSILDHEIQPWQVPIMMIGMKSVRMTTSPDYSDHSDDIEGYLDIYRTLVGSDMIQARSVSEYIEKKWPEERGQQCLEVTADENQVDRRCVFSVGHHGYHFNPITGSWT